LSGEKDPKVTEQIIQSLGKYLPGGLYFSSFTMVYHLISADMKRRALQMLEDG